MHENSFFNKLNLNNNKQNTRGITLIALVITIIVLLILAGVSIAMLTGENGILTQTQNAKSASKIADIKEKANADILGIEAGTQKTTISKSALKNILDEYFDNVPIELDSNTELVLKPEYGNSKMKVSDIYSGELTSEGLTAKEISNIAYKQNLYGARVNGYTLSNTIQTDLGWKIFYADNSNIYLIADNYIERENLPNSTTDGTLETKTDRKPNDGNSNYPRSAIFTSILEDYSGSSRISNKLKTLNNDYLNVKNYSSTNKNMKAVAYMFDTATWNSKLKDIDNKAEYVIGGPPIEMLLNSYNEKYGTSFMSEALSEIGYSIKKNVNDSWSSDLRYLLTQNDTIEDSLYMPSNTNAFAYWLSSPAADYDTNIFYISSTHGSIVPGNYEAPAIGFRPVICLNSDVQLQQISDSEYNIK